MRSICCSTNSRYPGIHSPDIKDWIVKQQVTAVGFYSAYPEASVRDMEGAEDKESAGRAPRLCLELTKVKHTAQEARCVMNRTTVTSLAGRFNIAEPPTTDGIDGRHC